MKRTARELHTLQFSRLMVVIEAEAARVHMVPFDMGEAFTVTLEEAITACEEDLRRRRLK